MGRTSLGSVSIAAAAPTETLNPSIDGNNRTGFVLLPTILLINGRHLKASKEEMYLTILALAMGTLNESELDTWIRSRIRRMKLDE
ncbi:MAG: hypothetical protein AABZ47_12695 [Planctomycetota bacterium]